eukprot:TRINITY_DN152_c0_g2_i10.p2 TRINITY_DN152_c0_g2~~TRINITY_DN152_c0_g2_i10.p2  ORF type:complete len:342 (+),score=166.05 TRINITY_DN152_c0_g2_i10:61-1026(+)
MAEDQGHFRYNGQLKGHGGWVTSIAAPLDNMDTIVTGSRDCSVIQWDVSSSAQNPAEGIAGHAQRRMDGHSNFIQDVQISSDGKFCLSASWDHSLRLWDLSKGTSPYRFMGHTKDVMSCAFSPDNRQIISGSRDKSLGIWNTLGEMKFQKTQQHSDWVSCVRVSPNPVNPLIVSAGWDKTVKVWSLSSLDLEATLEGHTGYVNTVTMSPDGSLCASGGKDGSAMLWDLDRKEHLYSLDGSDVIHELCFSPNRYWLCAATGSSIKIWDLESKHTVAELVPELPEMGRKAMKPECISLAWSADGSTLYSGYTDSTIRVWGVHQ